MQTLLDNQLSGIDKLRRFKVGALFMEPGTGKTRAAMELVRSIPDPDLVLWLTPFRTKENLRAELDKFGSLDCEIMGIETLSSSPKIYLQLYEHLSTCRNPVIVVDESLKIKNWGAKRTKRIIELGKFAQYKLILNGTPLSRNILDIWAQMEFLSPKILNMGLGEFKNTFCEYTRITRSIAGKRFTQEFITKYHNVDYLYSLIRHYVYECDLDIEVRKQYHDLPYQVPDDIKKEYYRLKEEYLDDKKLLAMNNNIFLELTQKMQHLYSVSPEKLQRVKEILSSNPEARVIAFTKYIASGDLLKVHFPGIIVLSYGKHALGLNLQQFNVCIFFDKTWDYAMRLQAERRIFRTGQTSNCIYYDLSGDVGLEEMINKNITKKQGLLDYFKSKAVFEIMEEL